MSVFEEAGYDTTDFLKGITTDELTEIGVQKPGHKKKIMTALSTVHHKEHLLLEKPVSGESSKWQCGSVVQCIYQNSVWFVPYAKLCITAYLT